MICNRPFSLVNREMVILIFVKSDQDPPPPPPPPPPPRPIHLLPVSPAKTRRIQFSIVVFQCKFRRGKNKSWCKNPSMLCRLIPIHSLAGTTLDSSISQYFKPVPTWGWGVLLRNCCCQEPILGTFRSEYEQDFRISIQIRSQIPHSSLLLTS